MADRPVTHLVSAPLDLARLIGEVASPAHGALVVFLGTVRDHHEGRAVRGIDYSAYPAMAEEILARIEHELGLLHGARVRVEHRLGELGVGEASIAIAVSAPHRAAAYEASRRALERVKSEVPIWKRELYRDGGAAWREVEPLRPPPSDAT